MYNEFQKELLNKVHERIESRGARFICCAITEVIQCPSTVTCEERFGYSSRFKEEIEFALDGLTCFELWIFSEVGVYPEDIADEGRKIWGAHAHAGWVRPMPRNEFENLCRICRLTWIERALETGSLL